MYRASLKTGTDGVYRFKTLFPPAYSDGQDLRPSHIHYRISHPEFQDLITQIYFEGEPHLDGDPAAASPGAAHRILTLNTVNGEHRIQFDVVMQKSLPLAPSVYSKIAGLYQLETGIAEFNRVDDLLYLKLNGQIMEGMAYKGENTFASAMDANRVVFEFSRDNTVKCQIVLGDFESNQKWRETHSGVKFIKYGKKPW